MSKAFGKITGYQLAKICGVSQGTVDRALNNRAGISPKTKEKILNAAKEYGYVKNLKANSLSSGKSYILGVVAFDLDNDYFAQTVDAISKRAAEMGYSVITALSYKELEKEKKAISQMIAIGVDGIILCPVGKGNEYSSWLKSTEIPIVTYGNKIEGIAHIGIDNKKAMFQVADRLKQKGFENFIYLYTAKSQIEHNNIYAQEQRYLGFMAATQQVKNRQVVSDEDYILPITKLINKGQKTVVICPSDFQAIKLLRAFENKPEGKYVYITGFDRIRNIDFICPNLSTVDTYIKNVGRIAVEEILSKEPKSKVTEYSITFKG